MSGAPFVFVALACFGVSATHARDGREDSGKARVLVQRAHEALARGEHKRALADFDEAIRLAPKNARAHLGRGLARSALNDYAKALDDFNEVIRLTPQDADGYYNRGLVRRTLGDIDLATRDFETATVLNPQWGAAFVHLGSCLRAKSEAGKAVTALDKGLGLLDDATARSICLYERAAAHFANRAPARAIADCDEALRLDPKCECVFTLRAQVRTNSHEFEKARNDFDAALAINPQSVLALEGRAQLNWYLREWDKACADAETLLKLDPKNGAALVVRARFHKAHGAWDKALADLDAAIRSNPNDAPALIERATIRAACPVDSILDGKQALADAKRACELSDWKDPYCLQAFAVAHAAAGDYREAVRWERKALEDSEYAKRERVAADIRITAYESQKLVRLTSPSAPTKRP